MKRNTAELKEKLIETGVEEIRTRGVDQLSIRTVAQRCGVTHGAPYKHFENKDVYLQVVLEHLSEIFLKYLTKGVDSSLDVRGQLVLMGCNFVEFAQKETNSFEALFIKFPFNYMELTRDSISVNAHLPGFEHFKSVVLELKSNMNISGSEAVSNSFQVVQILIFNNPFKIIEERNRLEAEEKERKAKIRRAKKKAHKRK